MMKVSLKTEDDVPVDLEIRFSRTSVGLRRRKREKELIDTRCRIFRYGKVIAEAVAYQSWRDKYNKIIGRKIALAKAIKQVGCLKPMPAIEISDKHRHEMRRQLWQVFHDNFGWN